MAKPRDVQTRILRGLVLLVFTIIITDLFYLQINRHDYYKGQSLQNRQIRTRVKAPRGRILDRNGEILVDNIYIADITLPRLGLGEAGPDSTLRKLVDWLGLDPGKTYARLQRQKDGGAARLLLIPNADMARIGVVEERRTELPGARVESRARRRYLYGPLFAHLTGYVGEVRPKELDTDRDRPFYLPGDVIGRQGIEQSFEKVLRGQPGTVLQEVNAVGRVVGRRDIKLVPVIPGRDVMLTLSRDLQDTLSVAMKGRAGCAIAMALPSGEIIAAVSLPSYDPNLFTTGISSADWNTLQADSAHPFLNRIVQAAYPPASPYKIVTSLAGLESGALNYHSSFKPCTGSYRFGNRDFGCWKKKGHGHTDHAEALIQSCDVFFYQAIQGIELDELHRIALLLGLGEVTGSPFGTEIPGIIPDNAWYDRRFGKRGWTRGVKLNNAIGQGEILVTPLQMVVLTGRVATGLANLKPRFVISDQPDPLEESKPLAMDSAHLAWVRHTMARVVDTGTGTRANLEKIEVAGKTGTAENPHGRDHAWFICFAPASRPEVAVIVILENAGHGGVVAAPVAARWLRAYFPDHATETSTAGRTDER